MLKSRGTLLVSLAMALLATTACGSSDSQDPATAGGAGNARHDKLPQQFKDSGVIRFAGDSHPPYRILGADGKTVTGIDRDLQQALGEVLGVRTEITIVPGLPSALSGMLAGRYDAFNGPVKDTAEREEKFDAIVWMVTRTAYLVPRSGSAGIDASDDLCGKRVAGVDGSIIEDQVVRLTDWCAGRNEPAVEFIGLADTNGTILAAKSGRADAVGMTESAALDAMAAEKNEFTYVTQTDEQGAGVDQLAMLVPKSGGLGPVMFEAFEEIFANGEYERIMKEYGLEKVAVDEPKLNTAGAQ
ncbi:transporter substrate-binding domain-containing protein [Actinophytocola glycyrrhizae]|uniref:Transporter substrate-binding domain-containing protein n=1 Tax=Actinophytocola glycyrrhizae TaxID=2044873 RepID=A0ABV9S2M5_9PSEU